MKLSIAASTLALALVLAGPAFAGTQGFDETMKPILSEYLEIHDSLASDQLKGVQASASEIARLSKKLDPASVTGSHAGHYDAVPGQIRQAAQALAAARNLDAARTAFKDLSRPMQMWASMSQPEGVRVIHCSMYDGGASWLQKSADVRNPYYGASMLACGEVVSGGGQDAVKHGHHGDGKHGGGHGRHGS